MPPTTVWRPGPGEPQAEIKQTATAFIETAGTWIGAVGAAATLRSKGVGPDVAATATALEAPDAVSSTVRVIYPQYGGVTADRAAVMVLFEQQLQTAQGATTIRQMALDVRLTQVAGGSWQAEEIRPLTSLGSSVPLSEAAQAVLAEPRLELSAPARLDVSSGRMDDRLLRVLLGLAENWVLTVQVMHTGHIQTVYPTERVSNHAVGRAVDIRAVDRQPVIDPATSREMLIELAARAGELGATEVGAPFDLNGDRSGFFTDVVHQDHLHVGITPGKQPATR
ncbi:hypothetical protein GCU67_04120 [Modestobacter muralis]|uniref:Uncharacterized protein n=1 Tax=Modestobacter muralis TaxID=1608614 RepID=A0A6P0ERD8_9ACTN|nr:hypothetical protein [Modestobacter muralis]NEN50133.1 hypothetical protein [Modestobacter muralis]